MVLHLYSLIFVRYGILLPVKIRQCMIVQVFDISVSVQTLLQSKRCCSCRTTAKVTAQKRWHGLFSRHVQNYQTIKKTFFRRCVDVKI